ncbi:enoyl-CoA hydratase [Actinokineospora alba]|uniref:Enoyl-CoA hydratase n=1 Tax=Actinokineospora alba TaxID=504798 RepID=A0A1H0GL81_9PSEU|nr:enoyl-CoA hydratase/isomerase family protein [Actinokineospora alba]TDP69936.1 enoyl-CoA hydratase [Actinokineospora alba]SDI05567.1 enoyl-CoA hydratase [Actinokineospora alba]SDO07461.1 enoyl-CoA hydratase [Actinokineospora alba]
MITVEAHGDLAVLRIDHGKVNALDLELCEAISRTVSSLVADGLIITGAGQAFSAGVDLRRVVEGGANYVADFLPALSKAFLAVFDCPRPVIAAVGGAAIAGGCVIAAAADYRIMSAGRIGLTELLVGVPFPVAALEIIRHAVGHHAQRLINTGAVLDAEAARSVGLVDEVVGPDDLLDRALTRATALSRIPPAAFALTKRQLHRPARTRIEAARGVDDPKVTALWQSPKALSNIADYLETLRQSRVQHSGGRWIRRAD